MDLRVIIQSGISAHPMMANKQNSQSLCRWYSDCKPSGFRERSIAGITACSRFGPEKVTND
jgi:hypothetical protein